MSTSCGASAFDQSKMSSTARELTRPLTVEEWKRLIQEDPFFKDHREPLNESEIHGIELAHQYYGKSFAGIHTRSIKDFVGDALMLGTGWGLTHDSEVGLTAEGQQLPSLHASLDDIKGQLKPEFHASEENDLTTKATLQLEKAFNRVLEHPSQLESEKELLRSFAKSLEIQRAEGLVPVFKQFHLKFNGLTGVPLTEVEHGYLEDLKSAFSQAVADRHAHGHLLPHYPALDTLKKKWYTVDLNKSTLPDLIASVTSETDMSYLPDHRFSLIYYENINYNVFLDPTTLRIAQRITKSGGTIRFTVAPYGTRLVAYMLHRSRWHADPQVQTVLAATGKWWRPLVNLKN
ncbi:MAG: hypothetical protein C0514_02130 [Candidatus Puniceispirillum sp.]|nr:hypothetical protein [Candidatus Puniceispirillum sp.]